MNYTQERMRKQQERERAVMHLNDFICGSTTDMADFVDVVRKVFWDNFKPEDKHRFNALIYQRVELTENNCHPKARAIASMLGESMPAEEFATHIAEVLRNEYGSHNFLPFITKLINELDNDTIG
jgi:hypothetical protein